MIKLKSPAEIEQIAISGKILANVLKTVAKNVKIGTSLKEIDELAKRLIEESGGKLGKKIKPAFLGYFPDGAAKPYGASICTSVNDTIVHGYPTDYKLKSGDVLKLDFGVDYEGYYSDSAITVGVGEISKEAHELIRVAKTALKKAVGMIKPGKRLGDVGWTISDCVNKESAGKFKVIKGLTGHGVGFDLHEDPTIYNYGEKGTGEKIKRGMVLAIEPMISAGSDRVIQKKDDSYVTSDGSLSAHFEHTVAVTEKGTKVLTSV